MKQTDDVAYDLEERTALFGEVVIDFCLTLSANPVCSPLISQLVSASTSVGANYCEADEAESKKDFRHKIAICHKEAKETKFWLRMIARAEPMKKRMAREIWVEAKELHSIFCAIVRTTDRNLRKENSEKRRVKGHTL
jgi:four helix bundle protein